MRLRDAKEAPHDLGLRAARYAEFAMRAALPGVLPDQVKAVKAALLAEGYSHEQAVRRLRCTIVSMNENG